MHKSWGNAIWFDDAAEKMGVDVMRWMYSIQNIEQNLLFGYGPANEVRKNNHILEYLFILLLMHLWMDLNPAEKN